MENKEIRNILLENIKNELKDFTQVQRNLKKSRKLEFRPKDKSLQSICDEISNNRKIISELLFYYRWLKHGLKYWTNKDIHDFWEYQATGNPSGWSPLDYRYKSPWWNDKITYEEYYYNRFYDNIISLIDKYDIDEFNEDFIKYLYKNI